ncbi:MAG: response regulator [Acetobacteraceae bacterium]|nr:response regulator [Acetobacteraceae bacterium]
MPWSKWPTAASAFRPRCCPGCSSRSSPRRKRAAAPAWGWPPSTESCARPGASSRSTASRAKARRSASTCRWRAVRRCRPWPSRFGPPLRARARPPSSPPPPPAAGTRGTLLLVEDEEGVRRLTVRALENAGWRVLVAPSGDLALQLLAREPNPPRIVVTDFVLPGMDGAEVVRSVRAIYPKVPVILVSGYAESAAREGLPETDLCFLAKPFTFRELLEAIERSLDSRGLTPRQGGRAAFSGRPHNPASRADWHPP